MDVDENAEEAQTYARKVKESKDKFINTKTGLASLTYL